MNIEVFLGSSCNLSCSYCFLKKGETITNENLNFYLKTIKELFEKNTDIKSIRFYGGEPMLKINSIKEILKVFVGRRINIYVVTNGLLENEIRELINLSYKNRFKLNIVFSIDNMNTYDISRRVNNYEIFNNFINLKDEFKEVNFSINVFKNNTNEDFLKILDELNIDYLLIEDINSVGNTTCDLFCENGLVLYKNEIVRCKITKSLYNINIKNNRTGTCLFNKIKKTRRNLNDSN